MLRFRHTKLFILLLAFTGEDNRCLQVALPVATFSEMLTKPFAENCDSD